VVVQIHKFCEFHDIREKFTALTIVSKKRCKVFHKVV